MIGCSKNEAPSVSDGVQLEGDHTARCPPLDSPVGHDPSTSTATTRPPPLKNRMRAQAKFVNRIKLIWAVQSSRKKYLASVFQKCMIVFAHPASSTRGVSRSSRT
jgi:hypothetical protein